MPEAAAPIVSQWILETGCRFRVAKSRSTKLGDYRAPFQGKTHQISVNHDLNPYAFLITTVHEFAHLKTWTQHKDRVKPHGREWKNNFKELMTPFFKLQILPHDVTISLLQYMDNPAASSCTDLNLYRTLKKYDQGANDVITVESVPTDSIFSIKNGRVFQKKEKLRKRFKCIELSTGRLYLFHPIAEVFPVQAS